MNIEYLFLQIHLIEMTSMCQLPSMEKPDLFSWSNLTFENTSCIETFMVSKEQFCNKEEASKTLLLVEEHSTFKDAKLNCEALQGDLFIPRNHSQLAFLGGILEASTPCKCTEVKGCAFVGGQKSNVCQVCKAIFFYINYSLQTSFGPLKFKKLGRNICLFKVHSI